jgi:hypothetical protein
MVRTFNRERGGTLGEKALGVAEDVWLEGQTHGNRSILPEISQFRYLPSAIFESISLVSQTEG